MQNIVGHRSRRCADVDLGRAVDGIGPIRCQVHGASVRAIADGFAGPLVIRSPGRSSLKRAGPLRARPRGTNLEA
jgi:hypothetical protein